MSRDAISHNNLGSELVGKYIEIYWPPDGLYYGARVLQWNSQIRRHLVMYDYGVNFSTEQIDLNNSQRCWRRAVDPFAGSINSFIGRIVRIDPNTNDSETEANMKLACVLSESTPRRNTASRLGRFSCEEKSNSMHRVLWIHGGTMDDVDLNQHHCEIVH